MSHADIQPAEVFDPIAESDAERFLFTLYGAVVLGEGDIPPEVVQWLRLGVKRLTAGETKTLDEGLGFGKRPGLKKIASRLRKHLRNKYLVELLYLYHEDGAAPWAAARVVSKRITEFEKGKLKKIRRGMIGIGHLDRSEAILLRLFEVDNNPARSESFLFGLLTETPLFREVKAG